MPQIKLLDGKKVPFSKSINGFELAKKISKSLEKSALIMEVDGILKDLSFVIEKDSKVRIITSQDKEGLEVLRHDAAHIMAMAVQELFPGTQVTIGAVLSKLFVTLVVAKSANLFGVPAVSVTIVLSAPLASAYDNANKLLNKLTGFKAFIKEEFIKNNLFYSVRIGPFNNIDNVFIN